MEAPEGKAPRGRPRTFDRDHVIAVAMRAYWEDGQAAVSLNAICARAGVSKPSLYREFGSEDGLKPAVLCRYHAMTLAPLQELLEADRPFAEALDALIESVPRDHRAEGMPDGCLHVDMCQGRRGLGACTGAQVDHFRARSLEVYEAWIARAQASGALDGAVSARWAALYIDARIATVMSLQRQGAAPGELDAVFRLAMSVFR